MTKYLKYLTSVCYGILTLVLLALCGNALESTYSAIEAFFVMTLFGPLIVLSIAMIAVSWPSKV